MKKKLTLYPLAFMGLTLIYLGGMAAFKGAQLLWVATPVEGLTRNTFLGVAMTAVGVICFLAGVGMVRRGVSKRNYWDVESDDDSITFTYHRPGEPPQRQRILFSDIGLVDIDRYDDSTPRLWDRSGNDIQLPIKADCAIGHIALTEEALAQANLKESWYLFKKRDWVIWVSSRCPRFLSEMPDGGASATRVGACVDKLETGSESA